MQINSDNFTDHKRKKIVILGNADSFWIQRFIRNVTIPLKQDAVIISAKNDKFSRYYFDNNIKVITTKQFVCSYFGHKFDALRVVFNTFKAIKSVKPDIIHVHYGYTYILRVLPYITKECKIIITFWGSDLLRATKKGYEIIKRAAARADAIVVGAEDLKNKLMEIGIEDEYKTSMIRMGIDTFSYIDLKREFISKIKQKYIGDSYKEKMVITVGYNAGKAQQHLEVIDSLAKLTEELIKRIVIVLPLTYKNDDKVYLSKIRERLQQINVKSIVINNFMDEDQVAELCLMTDIFINAQITDAISASMLEQLYSGSIVLNGEWLKYEFLERSKINCYYFRDFGELNYLLEQILKGKIRCDGLNDNIVILKNEFSWESSREKWKIIYNLLSNI